MASRERLRTVPQVRRNPDDAFRVNLGGIGMTHASATDGMMSAMSKLADAAVAVSAEPSVEGIVDMKGAQTQLSASVAAVKSVDESLGMLIDELA